MCYGRWDSGLSAFNVISPHPKLNTSLCLQSGMNACLETMQDNLLDIMKGSNDDIQGDVKKKVVPLSGLLGWADIWTT